MDDHSYDPDRGDRHVGVFCAIALTGLCIVILVALAASHFA